MKLKETNKIYIDEDSLLKPLLPQYLDGRKKDLELLKKALGNSDFDSIRKQSHTIAGHGGSYGLMRLTEICRLMEQAAENKDTKSIVSLLEEYDEYIHNIEFVNNA